MSFDDKTHGPGKGAISYSSYLRVSELTGLQTLVSDPAHHDEMLFIVMHQTYELWFKQLLHEAETVTTMITSGQILAASRLVGRMVEIEKVMVRQVNILETMTPMDFLAFRGRLQPASGFQSAQFREYEFVLGMRNPSYLTFYADDAEASERLNRRLSETTLPDALFALLRERGFDTPSAARDVDDSAAIAEVHRRRTEALAALYSDFESHYDLFLLLEALLELDEQLILWRQRHVMMVERVIGGRRGTGGSSGAAYLKATLDKRAFQELWDVRTTMSASHAY
jgi:tryptophan 2,3-dioxygenase